MTAVDRPRRPARKRAAASRNPERHFAQLGRLTTVDRRRKFLARHPELVQADTVTRLSEAVPQRVRVDAKEAMALADAAMMIARRLRRPESLRRSAP